MGPDRGLGNGSSRDCPGNLTKFRACQRFTDGLPSLSFSANH